MLISIFKTRLSNSFTINISSSIRIGSKKDNSNSNGNTDNKKFKKIDKSKSAILAKSRKIAQNNIIEFGLNFLIPIIKKIFNKLFLSFTQVSIFCYFDIKYYIYIKINILRYVDKNVLSKLIFGINFNVIAF